MQKPPESSLAGASIPRHEISKGAAVGAAGMVGGHSIAYQIDDGLDLVG